MVAFQLLILLLSGMGWGGWLLRGFDVPEGEELLAVVGGWCAGWVALNDLLRVGLRVGVSAWIAVGVALVGLLFWRGRKIPRWPFVVLIAVFGFQGAGLLFTGPKDYYGYARQDQVNYVQMAQFVVEKPFAFGDRSAEEIGLKPWLVKGVTAKHQRIGQSVALGDLAVLDRTDASQAYGTLSVFFVALTALATFGCLRSFGASRFAATLGGLWVGVLPGLTQNHLDGFLSQTSTVFVFIAVIWAARVATPKPRFGLVALTLALAFLLSSYSEEYMLAAGLAAAALGFSRRWGLAVIAVVAPWVLMAPSASDLARFAIGQYHQASNATALAQWEPRAGTWRGWADLFFSAPNHHGALIAIAAAAGIALIAFAARGAIKADGAARSARIAAFVIPAGALAALALFIHPFPQYAFGKLAVTFAPLAAVLAVLALPRRLGAVLVVPIALGAWSSWTKLEVVFHNGAGLPTMNSPGARATYRELEAHPERTYLIREPHGMLNSWLAYHARNATTYSAVPIGDAPMDSKYPFLGPPPPTSDLWEVYGSGLTHRAAQVDLSR